ncbi:ABC1 kinase family protein [Halobacteriovorax sp. ZH5_bin.2]|uniref:ABC1 kinase family protein n=1 Tax=unclassified Halobacteriovorax TaxID=2639665 RepID=UPI0037160ECE
MGLITTSFKITKTIRNISRLREIATVFAKNGLDEFVSQNVINIIPNFVFPRKSEESQKVSVHDNSWGDVMGYRLRLCFEELGPAFVKFGQLLSTREDIFDEDFIKHMKKLRDEVKPIHFSGIKKNVEASLGKKIEEVFKSVEEQPIGTASIGLVYRAELLTGEKVVLKVKRPGIDRIIQTDLSILIFLATQTEKATDDFKFLGFSKVLEDFSFSLQSELNFNVEALNCEKLKKIIAKYDSSEIFHLPKIYKDFTCHDLLVMELIEGIPFSDSARISEHIADLDSKLDECVKIFMRCFLNEGFFHADLHGGNFFYLPNGKIALIDFGLVGNLSKNARQNFIAIIYAILTQNFENLVYEFLDVAVYETVPDVDKLIVDIKNAIGPQIGLTVQQTNFSLIISSIITTLREHHIFLPSEWFVVFRALITLDGVGQSLDLDFDIFSLLEGDINDIIKDSFSTDSFIEDGMWIAKDVLSASRIVPRHLKWFLKEFAKNNYAVKIRHKGIWKPIASLASSVRLLSFYILGGVLFFAGKSFVSEQDLYRGALLDYPTITLILWLLSMGAIGYGTLKHRN